MLSSFKSFTSSFQKLKLNYEFMVTTLRCNSNRASIAKIGRLTYTRAYPTLLVLPDGSTINIRYHEPRKIIKLPLNMSTLTAEERELRLLKRIPKERVYIEDDVVEKVDVKQYLRMSKSRTRRK